MKLAFNSLNSGLGNNGGSRTVILCCKVLEELGHRCDIVATVDKFSWFKHKPPIKQIPEDLDAIIATGASTVETTIKAKAPIKAWYIRGHETWNNSEDALKRYYNIGLLNIVNSTGLINTLHSYKASCHLAYQGLDFELWKDCNLRPKDKIRIGCLYQKKKTKRWEDFIQLARILGTKDYEFAGMGDTKRADSFLTEFVANPTIEELNKLYSSCHIWFAPTELEGLHNPPMEAALCGSLLVCSSHELNGMRDYAIDGETAIVYPPREISVAADRIKKCNWDLIQNMKIYLKTKIGSREKNMEKFVGILTDNNMKKFAPRLDI